MSTIGSAESFDHTVQLRFGWNNKPRAYRLLKAVFHALRDWLALNQSAAFAAQLPGLLRGFYYEQWRPSITPVKKRSKMDFIAHINDSFKVDPLANPAQAIIPVLELLSEKITPGEIKNVRHMLPEDLRNLWPEHYPAAGAVR
jgi:uncharacterized protein (DUF2267 family)